MDVIVQQWYSVFGYYIRMNLKKLINLSCSLFLYNMLTTVLLIHTLLEQLHDTNNEREGILKDSFIAIFKILFRHLLGGNDEYRETTQ
jgi:hypothetical protein